MTIVHVNSYVKRNGTRVREHYRNVGDNPYDFVIVNSDGTIDYPRQSTLPPLDEDPYNHGPIPEKKGNFPPDEDPENHGSTPEKEGNVPSDEDNGGIDWERIGEAALIFSLRAIKYAAMINDALKKSDKHVANETKPKLDKSIADLKTVQVKSENLSKKYLDKLSKTKDNSDYKKYLESYVKQKEATKKIAQKLKLISYAKENNDYGTVMDELKNFQSDFGDVMKRTRQTRPLNDMANFKETKQTKSNYHYRSPITQVLKPERTKGFMDWGINKGGGLFKAPDAKELWMASSYDFGQSKRYIRNNGSLVYSVNDLPTEELQNIVIEKLEKQLGISDALGVIFKPHSRLSQTVVNSEEIKDYFLKNQIDLLNYQVITMGSSKFDSTLNLENSYNYVDIIYAYIDPVSGKFRAIVLDTWDFNPGENIIIKTARDLQDLWLIRNFYTLTLIEISMYEWLMWLLNQ